MASQDKAFGFVLSLISLVILGAWVYLMWLTPDVVVDLKFTAMKILTTVILVIAMLIGIWIGYTISTTPSIEELEAEVKKRRKK